MIFLIAFTYSLVLTGIVIITSQHHKHLTYDHDLHGTQKFHKRPTPRIGGLTILISFILSLITINLYGIPEFIFANSILISLLIVFMAGFLEDITKTITPLERTLLFIIALIVAIYLNNSLSLISSTGYNFLDYWLIKWPAIAIILTFFCVIGLTNAYNIIDGYHGLATIAAIFNLLGLAILSYKVHDIRAIVMMFAFIGASLGFLVYNYPNGKIFLGDGGAYMIGFGIAISSIKLIEVHPEISPYDVLLMAIYPITELGFSIYRKVFLRKTSPTKPDGLHLHMLIYKRCTDFHSKHRNPLVVVLMLGLIVPQIIFALSFHNNHTYCLIFIAAYIFAYINIYFRIIHFKTPALLKILLHRRPHVKIIMPKHIGS